jgi:ABC-type antimicrobial peptide transport system permease subunit
MGQLAIGAVFGVVAAALQERASRGDLMEGNGAVVLPIVVVFMTVVALLAALGPARRGLRIDPAEALRTEG